MVKHIILWQLKDEFSQEEKAGIKKDVKAGLDAVSGILQCRYDAVFGIYG